MSELVRARVEDHLVRLRLHSVAAQLDAMLSDAARTEPTYLDFLDGMLRDELDAKQKSRISMGIKIAHFPVVKTLDDFDFKFQPSVDGKLVREPRPGTSSRGPRMSCCSGRPEWARLTWASRSAAPPSRPGTRCCS